MEKWHIRHVSHYAQAEARSPVQVKAQSLPFSGNICFAQISLAALPPEKAVEQIGQIGKRFGKTLAIDEIGFGRHREKLHR